MKLIQIEKNQAGGRFDKFLFKYLDKAGSGFIYKMLRKKNITLNGKKADGTEKLSEGDEVKIFLSDETFEKFSSITENERQTKNPYENIDLKKHPLNVVYEDKNVLFLNKPNNMLSQKATPSDISINEYAIAYLLEKKQITPKELQTFKPSVCNRLDRNTTGLITVGVSMEGVRALSLGFKERTFDKYYLAVVAGQVTQASRIEGYLRKDKRNNKVFLSETASGCDDEDYIVTEYEPFFVSKDYSILKVKLITGKTHQIRVHLASIGNAIIGDMKYGNASVNQKFYDKYQVKSQLLHSYELTFPKMDGALSHLSNQTFRANVPNIYKKIVGADIF